MAVLLYSTAGGTWAVMATDFVQGLIMVTMATLLTVLCLMELGGLGGFFEAIRESPHAADLRLVNQGLDPSRPDPYQYTAPWAGALLVLMIFHNVSMGNAVKYFSAKTGRDARIAATVAGVLMVVAATVFFVPPITARLLFADMVDALPLSKPAEGAYAVASVNLLPESLLGIMLVSMFAATMSSMDTALNRNAAFVVRDIMPPVLRLVGITPPTPHGEMRVGQVFSALFGFAAMGIALFYTRLGAVGILEVTLDIAGLIGVPVAIPLVLGIFVRKTPGWSAIFTVCVALVPSAFALAAAEQGDPWPFHWKIAIALTTGTVAFLATRPFWSRVSDREQRRIQDFFQRMHTPVDFEKEVGQANDDVQLRVIGTVVLAVASFIALLMLVPQTGTERVCVFVVAMVLFLIGLGMKAAAWRHERALSRDP